jgi:excisionase family DNA binding protein
MADMTLGEAARAVGVSVDTLRRWDREGKLRTTRDDRNRRLVPASEIERLAARPQRHRAGHPVSARNRFEGTVRSVEELGLAAGRPATAVVKATSVMIEAPR